MSERDFGRLHASLQKAAASLASLAVWSIFKIRNLPERVRQHLSKCNEIYCDANTHVDKIAELLYPEDGLVDFYPVKVYGDGNCFYSALSKQS